MKITRTIEIEKEELQCDNCECFITGKRMWRVFEDGRAMENGNTENLDFCSKGCSVEWIKKNITTESILTEQVRKYKEELKGETSYS